MRAAGLHAIATVLTTEAVLIKSTSPRNPNSPTSPSTPYLPTPTSPPSSDSSSSQNSALIDLITKRIAGVLASNRYVLCQYNIRRALLPNCVQITPGRRAPTVSPLEDGEWVAVSSMVEKKDVATVMDRLVQTGAEDVLIVKLDNCRV
jgi:ATP phosphoribosyltransferase